MNAPSASTCLILKQHRRLRSLEQIIAERKQNGTGDLRSRKPHFHTHIHRHRSCSSSVCRFAATVTCACADWRCAATNIDDKLTLSSSQREWCLSFFALFFTAKNLISMSPECAGNPGDSVRINATRFLLPTNTQLVKAPNFVPGYLTPQANIRLDYIRRSRQGEKKRLRRSERRPKYRTTSFSFTLVPARVSLGDFFIFKKLRRERGQSTGGGLMAHTPGCRCVCTPVRT